MSGKLALASNEEKIVAAALSETLPPEAQVEVAVGLASLLARIVEAGRDE